MNGSGKGEVRRRDLQNGRKSCRKRNRDGRQDYSEDQGRWYRLSWSNLWATETCETVRFLQNRWVMNRTRLCGSTKYWASLIRGSDTSNQTQREKSDIKIPQTELEWDKRDRDEFGNGSAKAVIKKMSNKRGSAASAGVRTVQLKPCKEWQNKRGSSCRVAAN